MSETDRPRLVASYRSPMTEVRRSGVEGRGLFAVARIACDEVVAIKGGHIIDEETYQRSKATVGNSDVKIADGFHIGALSRDEYEGVMMFLNHSCEPNVGVQGDTVFVAMREIEAGEELCLDYALIDDYDDEMACRCGTASCRGVVSGRDWQREELQARYGHYCSAYLLRKMDRSVRLTAASVEAAEDVAALLAETYAEQLGEAYAHAARGARDVVGLWVSTVPGFVHLWLVTQRIDVEAERRLYGLTDALYDQFRTADFMLHVLNPHHFRGDVRNAVPRDALQIPLHRT